MRLTWTSGWESSSGAYRGVTLYEAGTSRGTGLGDTGKPLLELLA